MPAWKPDRMGKVVGIDLGTTNSVVAALVDGWTDDAGRDRDGADDG